MNFSARLQITNHDIYPNLCQRLTKRYINERLSFYGFMECAKMSRFLEVVVEDDIDTPSYRYLLACLNDCLQTHASGYKEDKSFTYFMPLVRLRDEIELLTLVSGLH